MATTSASRPIGTCLTLTKAISRSRTVEEIYEAALDALHTGLGVERASILLFDADGVMRFAAYRGLSSAYRRAVEGHTPWRPDSPDPEPIWVQDVAADSSLAAYLPTFRAEGIAAMAFIPLLSPERVIGKFMLYYPVPTAPTPDVLELAGVVAAQVAFALERTRTAQLARWSEARLRFALDAASMGTWDWDLATNVVQWSDNLERMHGLPPGTFDGTFTSYERNIHPEDRRRVFASVQRALREHVLHDVEYRIVAPDGTVRWCDGKGRVEFDQNGRPVRMTGVCIMVTRRKEAELARLAAAEESNRVKDEFLATLSHELRTPLNAILGWVQVLQNGELSPARARQAMDVIGRNARLQAQLIEDILDVSRIISGKLEVERVPVSISQLLETAVSDIAPAAEAKRITIDQNLAAELPPLEGDPKRLQQVLNNVLSNAVKFTPEGGSIALDCHVEGHALRIRVRDSGAGISADFLPFVFDRFRQADSRSTRSHGGLGLGLAIARHLVEQHGGSITAQSDGQGRGTTIVITFPVGVEGAGGGSDAPPGLDDVRLDGLRILVVDDQADSREMLAALLELRGARVVQREDAKSALALIGSAPVDVMIADIAMPDVNGYELMKQVRAAGNRVPSVAVTAFARPDDRRTALDAGFTAYLAKPIDGRQLASLLRDMVPAA